MKIGKGSIGDALVGGPIVLFDGKTEALGSVKLVKTNETVYELTVGDKKTKLVYSNKVGNA
jgi:hypothetical protein